MVKGELKSKVDKIWATFWTGGISNPLTVIEQFTYLLFLRRLDERQKSEEMNSRHMTGQLQNPIYKAQHQILRWSNFKNKDPSVMFDLFTRPQETADNLTVFEHMKQAGETTGVFAQYMKGATFMIPTAKLLFHVVNMISDINMDEKDTTGDLYEYLLSKISTSGTNGQFRTPRHIIKLMVDMMQPSKDDMICDPSSGTAGFLVGARDYIVNNHQSWLKQEQFTNHFHTKMFTGIEFDSTMLRISAMNLQLHGIEQPHLIGKDALSESNANMREKFSLMFANPPFKGSLDYDSVEGSLLTTVKTKKTELLFLALMLRMLKVGGRCAAIVPDGVLFGSSKAHRQIRQHIVEKQKLEAIISMPSGVFKPYAGVSTAIVIFTKTDNGGTDNVWFYDMQADGYSLDDKRIETKENDLPDILARFQNRVKEKSRKRTEQSFLVPFEEIKQKDWDLSINCYKEIVYQAVDYQPPEQIIAEIEQLDKERQQTLAALRGMLVEPSSAS